MKDFMKRLFSFILKHRINLLLFALGMFAGHLLLKEYRHKEIIHKVETAKFDIAIEYVLKNEGGLVDNPSDRGGLTKYGISKASYPYLDIRKLTKEDAIKIYRKDFYDRFKLNRIKNQKTLNIIFDMAVLMGKSRATLIFESTLNKLGHQIPKDGILDDQMIAIINEYNEGVLLNKYREELKKFIDRIIEVNPSQHVFRKGWYARIDQ